jgi:hypothetical protein
MSKILCKFKDKCRSFEKSCQSCENNKSAKYDYYKQKYNKSITKI